MEDRRPLSEQRRAAVEVLLAALDSQEAREKIIADHETETRRLRSDLASAANAVHRARERCVELGVWDAR
jgi:hypothetical protein